MRLLGIDVGTRRIGVALSDPTGMIAQGLTVIARTGPRTARGTGPKVLVGPVVGWKAAVAEIARLVAEHGVERIVVGLPLRMDGSEGDAAREARTFARRLQETVPVPVVMQDERLSTAEAERVMVAGDARRERRRAQRDAVAAALFLQTYLDRQRRAGTME